MKFSLFTDYGASNSKPVFEAFAESLLAAGHEVSYNDNKADVAVIWSVLWHGKMEPNKKVFDRFSIKGKPVIVLEVGGIKRGTTWKVGLGGVNREAYFAPKGNDDSRAKQLGLELKPYELGEKIYIIGQHTKSHQWRDESDIKYWTHNTCHEIRQVSDRPIVIRPHPRCLFDIDHFAMPNVELQLPKKIPNTYDDFDFDISDAYAVIAPTSNTGPQSVIAGKPIWTWPASLAYPVSNTSLRMIEKPLMPDRQQWLNDYAHTEYTLEEISQGIPLKHLTNKIQSATIAV